MSEPENVGHARAGLALFAVYLAFYAGFVLVNAFAPSLMEAEVVGGVNLAITYGMGLIVGAFAMALVYSWICRRTGPASTPTEAPR